MFKDCCCSKKNLNACEGKHNLKVQAAGLTQKYVSSLLVYNVLIYSGGLEYVCVYLISSFRKSSNIHRLENGYYRVAYMVLCGLRRQFFSSSTVESTEQRVIGYRCKQPQYIMCFVWS